MMGFKRLGHKLFQIVPYLVWHALLLGRNKCLSPKSYPSREIPQSLQKGYPVVSDPTESSSGIPQSCCEGDPATRQKKEQTLSPTTPQNAWDSFLLKGEGWGIHPSCFKESGGLQCSTWLPAHSANKNPDTRHWWVVKAWRSHQTEGCGYRRQGQWSLLASVRIRMVRVTIRSTQTQLPQRKFLPYTS